MRHENNRLISNYYPVRHADFTGTNRFPRRQKDLSHLDHTKIRISKIVRDII